jgi:GGDEF domain-containing protein
LNDSRQTSLILIRGISTSTTTLLERIKRLLRRDDSVHLVEEDQLLVVMKDSSSTHGAHFVRRLRQVGVKEVLNRPSGKRKSSLSFRTAIVSAPEDGSTIGTLFDKASLAFEVTKRSGTINTPFSEGTLQERSTSV